MSANTTGSTGRPFLTVALAVDDLTVTERFFRKPIANGDLRAVKVGARVVRIRRNDLGACSDQPASSRASVASR